MPLAAAVFSGLLLHSFLQSFPTPTVDLPDERQQMISINALPAVQHESPTKPHPSIALPPAFKTALSLAHMGSGSVGQGTMTNGPVSNGPVSNGTVSNGTVGNGTADPDAPAPDVRTSANFADAQQRQHNSFAVPTTDATDRMANAERKDLPKHPFAEGQNTPAINFANLVNNWVNEPVNPASTPAQFAASLMPANAFATSVTAVPPITHESWLAFAPENTTPEGIRVVIDPGHGGSDPGTVGPSGQTEKVLTLAIARRVQTLLHSRTNIQVSLTRDSDAGLSRRSRLNHVTHQSADLLISLHLNNLPQQNITLVESFYAGTENILESMLHLANNNRQSHSGQMTTAANSTTQSHVDAPVTTASLHRLANASKRLSGILQHKVFTTVKHHNPRAVNAGVKTDTLYMLTRSQIPAALIELTCLSNSAENERLNTAAYREALSEAIARGIVEYFVQPEHNTGI